MNKILVIHGPNLNLLGERETSIYGNTTLSSINKEIETIALNNDCVLHVVQSNHEGEIVDIIGKAKVDMFKAIIINPAAYTHTSVAIRDAISAVNLPAVEVHLSNIYSREDFRHNSLIAPVCVGQVSGFGAYSYVLALNAVMNLLKK